MNLEIIYSEERGTWNLINTEYNEWIFEGTYEQCMNMWEASFLAYAEDQANEDYGYSNEYDY